MGRPLMYQEHPWQPVEITMRCMQSRLLMRPGEECNRRVLGVLGRAMELYGQHTRLYFAGGTSNHLHLVAAFESAEWKARFKAHIKANISKELGALFDWPGTHWDRRSRDIHILDDEAFEDRLMYLAAHGVKDGLVETPHGWPGIGWVRAVTEGRPLVGVWYDRTRLDAMQRAWERQPVGERGRRPSLQDVATRKVIDLTPPPMWADLPTPTLRARWTALVADALERHRPSGSGPPLGEAAVRTADPHERPAKSKRSPAPAVHTRSRALRQAWWAGYVAFVETWRAALQALRAGCAAVGFPPEGCRPAGLAMMGGDGA
ncbi:MAG: hypothetical protein H6701_15670 [Myxococcales bacterium]|nr:hypothetical protein [Myxococcales bacterium]